MENNGSIYYYFPYSDQKFQHFNEPLRVYHEYRTEFQYEYKTNSLGLRGDEIELFKVKVMLLGDSFVEGVGLEHNKRLNVHLENHLLCFECVLNAGSSASDLIAAYDAMLQIIERGASPDLVILNINSTDIEGIIRRHIDLNFRPSKYFQLLYGSSFIVRHITHNFLNKNYLFLNPKENENLTQKALGMIGDYALKYDDYLTGKGVDFLILLQPMIYELYMNQFPLTDLNDFLLQNGIKHYNAFDDFQNLSNFQEFYWPRDMHFNAKGSEYYSKLIFNILKENFDNKYYPGCFNKN